ncbi:hypothetical protein [Oryzihumus leptocrescens]|uniref:hypothetical protein n=1 Tax=Oryzihumus leptocrescens TaxID=297536 RepID=UPI001150F379|nr:hypothetical protein [Oryzihumus leptocrescens]
MSESAPPRRARDRYDAVPGLLVLGYLLSAISVAGLGRVVTGVVYLAALVVAWASSVLRRLRGQLAAAALLLLALPVAVARLVGAEQTANVLGSLWLSLVQLLTLVTRSCARHRRQCPSVLPLIRPGSKGPAPAVAVRVAAAPGVGGTPADGLSSCRRGRAPLHPFAGSGLRECIAHGQVAQLVRASD